MVWWYIPCLFQRLPPHFINVSTKASWSPFATFYGTDT